ncbi:glycosyltransferase family 8 protein, partial [Botryobasidium botryosum FD-172 SS1]
GFDFVYIDGSHRSDDTFLDAELAWRLMRPGALVIFDDYEWKMEPAESMTHPKRGIDAFLALQASEYEILHKGYQVILRKTAERRIGFLTKKETVEVDDVKLEYGINIAMCADSAYAMPTAVAVRSAVDATEDRRMSFYIIDCGLSEDDKKMIRESVPASTRVTLQFIELPDGSKGRRDPTWAKIDALSLLPVERALFLDSDILVRKALGALWSVDLHGKMLAAVRDIGHPLGHSGVERGPYFNAGVMLLDMARIRARLRDLFELVRNRAETTFKDQDVLNTFFRDEWLEIDLGWNATGLGTYAAMHSEDRAAVWPHGELKEAHRNPGIVHFSGPTHPTMASVLNEYVQPWISKPWGYAGAPGHPFAEEWWSVLGKTVWKNWRQSEERKAQQEEAEKRALSVDTDEFLKRVSKACGRGGQNQVW